FDKLDVSEALGHELSIACLRDCNGVPTTAEPLRDQLGFRTLIGDPFDPARRAIIPAVTTLTIRLRRYPAAPSFLLHWRDPAKVATAAGVYDVIPAGEFQPASVALWDRRNDFDLWRNIVREYSEELLGTPEHDGTRSKPINYHGWPLYCDLEDAQKSGALVPFALGLGLDALTLAATILTVVVIDDDVFTRAFGGATRYNEEGEIVAIGDGRATEGIPFTQESVRRLLTSEPMASPGAACLALAWRHRDRILGL
ncbi:MAG: helix-turn-helix domain-containing protein, partial [Sciscionella sp.]